MDPKRLHRAKQRLLDKGWIQGEYRSTQGSCCLVGALAYGNDASLDDVECDWPEFKYLGAYLERRYSADGIVDWNDMPGRTIDDVIALLDGAAEEMEKLNETVVP